MSLLGGILVFLMFVQGGQSLLYAIGRSPAERDLLINSLGLKWKLTFTTLVTFGGAFFASFPVFYATSFGGAFYVWMLILLLFVLQGVSYEFHSKAGNLFGRRTYEWFLILNGIGGALLIGTAVGTFFTGANFVVDRARMGTFGGDVTISYWTSPWHGLEAVTDYRNLLLGVTVVLLTRCLALQYFINNIGDKGIEWRSRKRLRPEAAAFVLCFVGFVVALAFSTGWNADYQGVITREPFKYFDNFTAMPVVAGCFVAGVLAVLAGLSLDVFAGSRKGIWLSGGGTILTVMSLLLLAGWNHTSFYPSLSDMQSSLTIANASSSRFTLLVMGYVSLLIPFVAWYIWYVWRAMNRRRLTAEDVKADPESY
jgi:cytochrome d ubiquinol oxidase subunit II